MIYDLHIHTTISDGKYDKVKLLHFCNENNIEVVAFADHNIFDDYSSKIETDYIKEYGEKSKVYVINAIELDIVDISQFHLLAYDMKNNKFLAKYIADILRENNNITEQIVKKIYQYYNIKIPLEELYRMSLDCNINKKTIIQWMLNNNYAKTWNEAGYLYTSKYSPCYIKKKGLHLQETIEMIKAGNGYSVFAHPSTIKYSDFKLEQLVKELATIGLDGIEVFNASKTTIGQMKFYLYLSEKYNLLTTCGSDFHNENTASIGIDNDISSEFIRKIKSRR